MVDLASAPAVEAAPRWPSRVLAAATAAVLVLVLLDLGSKSLWYDEAFSIGIVDRPIGDALWRMAHWEVNQSPFYLLLAGWWRLGQGEGFLRLLPAASAVASVPAIYSLGRRVADARVGAIAAVLLALHPLAVSWGQQLRAYSLVVLLVIVATILVLRAVERADEPGPALAYAAVAALATYTHFFAGLVVATHGLWLLLRRPVPRRLVTTAGLAYAALVAPLLWYLVTVDGDPLYWVSDRTSSALVDVGRALAGGTRWGVIAYTAAAAVGLVAAARAGARLRASDRWEEALPALWLVAPVAVVTASTATVKPLLAPRFLIVVLPALVLVAAVGLRALSRPLAAALLAGLVLASGWGLRAWYQQPSHEDWRAATRFAVTSIGPGDSIAVAPPLGVFAVRYYEDRMGVEEHPVVSPWPDDGPAGPLLAEIRRQEPGGWHAPLEATYVEWRDRYYALAEEKQVEKAVVRIYERR